MIIKKVSLKTLLVCTVFASPLWAMEADSENPIQSYLAGQSSVLDSAAPKQNMASEFSTQFLHNMTEKTKEKALSAFDMGKKVISERDFGPLVMGQLENYLTAANQTLVGEFFKPKNRFSQEFDVEALRPLVEAIRGKLCDMIEYLVLKRNLYGYVPGVGRIKIYEDKTVFRLLLETFVPDLVPAKGLMIKVADIGPIRNYLMYKFDEMIISSLLAIYKKTTGNLVKQSVEDLVSGLTKKTATMEPEIRKVTPKSAPKVESKAAQGEAKADKKVESEAAQGEAKSAPKIESKATQGEAKLAPKVESKATQGEAKADKKLESEVTQGEAKPSKKVESEVTVGEATPQPIQGSKLVEKVEPEVKKSDDKGTIDSKASANKVITIDDIPFVEISQEEVEKEGTHVWEFLQPRLTYLMRAALCDILKPGVESVIKELGAYGQKQLIPSTSTTSHYLASMGVASGVLGFWWGVPLGAGGYYAYNTAMETFRDVLRKRMLDHVDLFVKYHTYNFLPYTPEEHYLYHLNSNPSSDEKDILADEYKIQEKVREQGILKALLQDLTQQTWIGHLISAGEMAKIDDFIAPTVTQKNSLSAQITMGEIADVKKRGGKLSKDQEQLLKNLLDFPSYKIKQKELELIGLWGEKNKAIFHEARTVREKQQVAQDHLIKVYQMYGQIVPANFASAYQDIAHWGSGKNWELFPLHYIEVEEIIAESVKKHIGSLGEADLKLFHEGLQDWQFVSHYVENFVKTHDLAKKKDFNEADAENILRDERLLKDLPSAFVRKKEKDYIQAHENDLINLGKSPLGFGVTFAELVDLHKHMTVEQIQQFTKVYPAYDEILDVAGKSLLGAGDSGLDVNPYVESVKAELLTIRKTLKGIAANNRGAIIKHYANQFIKQANFKAYIGESFKLIPSTVEGEALKFNLEDDKYAPFKALCDDNLSPKELQVAIVKGNYLAAQAIDRGMWQAAGDFRKSLPGFLADGSLRTSIYRLISNHIVEMVVRHMKDAKAVFTLEDLEIETSPVLDDAAIKIMPFADYGVYNNSDFTGFYICEIINQLFQDGAIKHSSMLGIEDVKDLMIIHQKIQDRKQKTMDLEALLLSKDHLNEILKIKGSLPKYENHLFYGFSEILDEFKKQQQEILKKIQAQELRKL